MKETGTIPNETDADRVLREQYGIADKGQHPCVCCGDLTKGRYGDTGIAICEECYIYGIFRVWLDERGF